MAECNKVPFSSASSLEVEQHLEDVLAFIDAQYSQSELRPYMNDSDTETLLSLTSRQDHDDNNNAEECQLLDNQLTPPPDGQHLVHVQNSGLVLPNVLDNQLTPPPDGQQLVHVQNSGLVLLNVLDNQLTPPPDGQQLVHVQNSGLVLPNVLDNQLTSPLDGHHLAQVQDSLVPDVENDGWNVPGCMPDYPIYTPDESSEMTDDTSQKPFTDDTARNETTTVNAEDLFICEGEEMSWMDTNIWAETSILEDNSPDCEISDNIICDDQVFKSPEAGNRGQKLTPEEARERKRLLNRQAAKRCRDKKLKEHQDLEKRVKSLRSQHDFLRKMRQRLVQTWSVKYEE